MPLDEGVDVAALYQGTLVQRIELMQIIRQRLFEADLSLLICFKKIIYVYARKKDTTMKT